MNKKIYLFCLSVLCLIIINSCQVSIKEESSDDKIRLTNSPLLAQTTSVIYRTAEYTGLIYYNKNTKAYSAYSAIAYPNAEGDLIEGTTYYNDTHGYAGFSLASIPVGNQIVSARAYYTTYFPVAPYSKGNCTLYKGEQHADISTNLASDYANNGWNTIYANMTPVNNNTQMMSDIINQTGLDALNQALTTNKIFTVGFRQQSGTRSRFANSKIYLEIKYEPIATDPIPVSLSSIWGDSTAEAVVQSGSGNYEYTWTVAGTTITTTSNRYSIAYYTYEVYHVGETFNVSVTVKDLGTGASGSATIDVNGKKA